MPSNMIHPRGTILQERYRIIEAVGTGGYGVVYQAEDTRYNDFLVAVKSINLAGLSTQEVIEATEAFNREVLMLSKLKHFSLPGIHDHFTDPAHWYMVMDFIEGETLEDYITQAKHTNTPQDGTRCLPLLEVLEIGMQLCTVLGYLHTQEPSIIFRDLKPTNIMRMPDGHLYLIDFGIARQFKHGQAKDTIPLGSPGYAAPEQYGRTQTTPRADIYSLGAVLHQLISGDDPSESPFHFAHLHAGSNPILATLDELLLQMVEKDERNRPASVTIVKRRLQQIRFQATPPRVMAPPIKARKIDVSRRVFVGTLATMLVAGTLVRTIPLAFTGEDVSIHDNVSLDVPSASGGPSDIQGAQLNTALYTYQNHKGSVTTVAWSPAGDVVASGDAIGNVYVWKPFTGETMLSLPSQKLSVAQKNGSITGTYSTIQSLSWSADGQQLAIAKGNGILYIWDIKQRVLMLTYENYMNIGMTAWSPNGKYIAASNNGIDMQIWDAGTTRQVADLHLPIPADDIFAHAFIFTWSPDSRYIATGSPSAMLVFYDTATGKQVYRYDYINDNMITNVEVAAWSPNGRFIVVGGLYENSNTDYRLMILPALKNTPEPILSYDNEWVSIVEWSPDSKFIALDTGGAAVQVWNASTGQIMRTYTGHTGLVNAISWSPDGTLIASGSNDGIVQVWKP